MPSTHTFDLPDVGEGLIEAEVVNWVVSVGDTVEVNDVVVEIETEKSLVELPSPYGGVVEKILVDAGQTVPVGTPLIQIGTNEHSATPTSPHSEPVEESSNNIEAEKRPTVLVGYGPGQTATRRRVLRNRVPSTVAPTGAASSSNSSRPLAKPPVRHFAKQLGVDLSSIAPGPDGVITRLHIEAAARATAPAATSGAPEPRSVPQPAPIAASGPETRQPIKGVRKTIAAAMVKSAFTAPHATLWLSIDMTETMNLVRTLRADKAWANVRVTPLLILAKAILLAVRRNPGINASWDDAAQEIVTKHYVNLGIAAATPRGLIVPNIKNADRLPLNELAVALDTLVTRAREGHTAKEDMTQGTFTITNVGVFGIDGATPILNPGEAGILAVGATRTMPWVVDDQLSVREIAQLSLSIDHRVVDGELGSRFLADVGRIMERPSEAFFFA